MLVENQDRLPILQSALLTVARQEIDRFNKLLETVQTSLRALNRAIDGEIVMSESLERTYEALLSQKVSESYGFSFVICFFFLNFYMPNTFHLCFGSF